MATLELSRLWEEFFPQQSRPQLYDTTTEFNEDGFRPLTDINDFALDVGAVTSQQLYTAAANIQSVLKDAQDEYLGLETEIQSIKNPVPDLFAAPTAKNPTAPYERREFEELKEADLYGYKYKYHKTPTPGRFDERFATEQENRDNRLDQDPFIQGGFVPNRRQYAAILAKAKDKRNPDGWKPIRRRGQMLIPRMYEEPRQEFDSKYGAGQDKMKTRADTIRLEQRATTEETEDGRAASPGPVNKRLYRTRLNASRYPASREVSEAPSGPPSGASTPKRKRGETPAPSIENASPAKRVRAAAHAANASFGLAMLNHDDYQDDDDDDTSVAEPPRRRRHNQYTKAKERAWLDAQPVTNKEVVSVERGRHVPYHPQIYGNRQSDRVPAIAPPPSTYPMYAEVHTNSNLAKAPTGLTRPKFYTYPNGAKMSWQAVWQAQTKNPRIQISRHNPPTDGRLKDKSDKEKPIPIEYDVLGKIIPHPPPFPFWLHWTDDQKRDPSATLKKTWTDFGLEAAVHMPIVSGWTARKAAHLRDPQTYDDPGEQPLRGTEGEWVADPTLFPNEAERKERARKIRSDMLQPGKSAVRSFAMAKTWKKWKEAGEDKRPRRKFGVMGGGGGGGGGGTGARVGSPATSRAASRTASQPVSRGSSQPPGLDRSVTATSTITAGLAPPPSRLRSEFQIHNTATVDMDIEMADAANDEPPMYNQVTTDGEPEVPDDGSTISVHGYQSDDDDEEDDGDGDGDVDDDEDEEYQDGSDGSMPRRRGQRARR